jgi:streptomycin 6-kinase
VGRPWLVREALTLFEELPRSAPREAVLATDLHAGNVLRAQREPWLAIDPKPFVGDPAYDATQHLLNCGRLWTDPSALIGRVAELLDLDRERVRSWTFARVAIESFDDRGAHLALARGLAG